MRRRFLGKTAPLEQFVLDKVSLFVYNILVARRDVGRASIKKSEENDYV